MSRPRLALFLTCLVAPAGVTLGMPTLGVPEITGRTVLAGLTRVTFTG